MGLSSPRPMNASTQSHHQMRISLAWNISTYKTIISCNGEWYTHTHTNTFHSRIGSSILLDLKAQQHNSKMWCLSMLRPLIFCCWFCVFFFLRWWRYTKLQRNFLHYRFISNEKPKLLNYSHIKTIKTWYGISILITNSFWTV